MPQLITGSLVKAVCNYYGNRNITWQIRSKEERLFSDIIICDLIFSTGCIERVCIKKYKESFSDIKIRIFNEFIYSEKYNQFFRGSEQFFVVDNICLLEDELTLVAKYIPGHDLYHYTRRFPRQNQLKQIFYDSGVFLREFHGVSKGFQIVDFTQFGEYIDIRLKNICKFDTKSFGDKDRNLFLSRMMQLCEVYKKQPLQVVGLHGDFIPPNVRIQCDGKLCLLDFSNVRSGVPYDEIAYFVVFMWCHDLLMPRDRTFTRALIGNFLEGYGGGSGVCLDPTLLGLYSLKHLINQMWGFLRRMHDTQGLNIKKIYWQFCYSKVQRKTKLMINGDFAKNQPFSEVL